MSQELGKPNSENRQPTSERHPWEGPWADVQSWVPWGRAINSPLESESQDSLAFNRLLDEATSRSERDEVSGSEHRSAVATTGLVATLLGHQDDRWFMERESSAADQLDARSPVSSSYDVESFCKKASPSRHERGSRGHYSGQNIIGSSTHPLDPADNMMPSPAGGSHLQEKPWEDSSLFCSSAYEQGESNSNEQYSKPHLHEAQQSDLPRDLRPQRVFFVPTSPNHPVPSTVATQDPCDLGDNLRPKLKRAGAEKEPGVKTSEHTQSTRSHLFDSPYDVIARVNSMSPRSQLSRQDVSCASNGPHTAWDGPSAQREDSKLALGRQLSRDDADQHSHTEPRDSSLGPEAEQASLSELSVSATSLDQLREDHRALSPQTAGKGRGCSSDSNMPIRARSPVGRDQRTLTLTPQRRQSPLSTPQAKAIGTSLSPVPRKPPTPASSNMGASTYSIGSHKEFAAMLAREIARELEYEDGADGASMHPREPGRLSFLEPETYKREASTPSAAMQKFREAISSGDLGKALKRGEKLKGLDLIVDIVSKQKRGKAGNTRKTPRKKTKTKSKTPPPVVGATKGLVSGMVEEGESRYSLRCMPRQQSFTRWVFAKDLTAYKAVAAATTPAGDPLYLSIYDGRTCYLIGQEAQDTGMGIYVYMSPKEALAEPIYSKQKDVVDKFPRLVLKVLVSGKGYQMGNKYAFPVLRPISVIYPDEIIEPSPTQSISPEFEKAMENANRSNVLQTLREFRLAVD